MYSRWLSNLRSPHVISELYFSVSVCGGGGRGVGGWGWGAVFVV